MKRVIIFSDTKTIIDTWSGALSKTYEVLALNKIDLNVEADAIVIDSQKINHDKNLLSLFNNKNIRFLIVGLSWPESSQINALTHGAAGYCEISEPPKLIRQALGQILKGEIWVPRHLIPKVIGSLMQMKAPEETSITKENTTLAASTKLLESLSSREMDVAKMIQTGKNNKTIASTLHISERTVKAHLTSIFKKLNVPSRLHLAIFIKELG